MKKMLFAALLVSSVVMTGCTGSFKLTTSIYKWHTGFDNKLTDEFVFLGSCLLCYPFTLAGDLLIFNTIEFWLDSNPIDGALASSFKAADGSEVVLTRTGDAVTMDTAEGLFTFTRNADGTLLITNDAGETLTAAMKGDVLTMTAADGTCHTFTRTI